MKRKLAAILSADVKGYSRLPNNAENLALLGMTLLFAGRFEESVEVTRKATRLHPYYPPGT